MAAELVDLIIDRGEDWSVQLYWTDYGSNPFTVLSPIRMEIRANTGQVLATLTPKVNDDDYPYIIYNSESGLIQLQIPSEETDAMPPGIHRYDLFVTYDDQGYEPEGTKLTRLIYGSVTVRERVTQVV